MDLGRAGGNILRSRGDSQCGVCDAQNNVNLFSFTDQSPRSNRPGEEEAVQKMYGHQRYGIHANLNSKTKVNLFHHVTVMTLAGRPRDEAGILTRSRAKSEPSNVGRG